MQGSIRWRYFANDDVTHLTVESCVAISTMRGSLAYLRAFGVSENTNAHHDKGRSVPRNAAITRWVTEYLVA